jgi:hypothetical protein
MSLNKIPEAYTEGHIWPEAMIGSSYLVMAGTFLIRSRDSEDKFGTWRPR